MYSAASSNCPICLPFSAMSWASDLGVSDSCGGADTLPSFEGACICATAEARPSVIAFASSDVPPTSATVVPAGASSVVFPSSFGISASFAAE